MKVKSLSRVRLLATQWTAAYKAPPSMGFSRLEYWSGFPLPSPSVHVEAPIKSKLVAKIHLEVSYKNLDYGTSPNGLDYRTSLCWIRLCAPNAGGLGSIPGQGTKTLHTATKPVCHNKDPAQTK